MEILTSEQYENICRSTKVLQEDSHGVKLLALPNGSQFIKIFRRKKLISSTLLKPYAKRFRDNAKRLNQLGIPTVKVNKVCYCRPQKRHLIFYLPLPGTDMRGLLSRPIDNEKTPMLEKFARLLANLHEKGIYFRSIHFGNIIVSPDQKHLSLIDIADIKFYSSPLNMKRRLRNFKHFLRYPEDMKSLHQYGLPRFLEVYALESRLSRKETTEIQNLINAFLQERGLLPFSTQ